MTGPRIVLVVGPFRSGTSLVAQVVHHLGWPVGVTIPAPTPPTWRSDWEDGELTVPLLQGYRPSAGELASYLRRRTEQSHRLGFGGRVAVKSPYLALVWGEMLAACRLVGESPFVVRTYRNEGREESLARTQLSREDDDAIGAALCRIEEGALYEYGDVLARPRLAVRRLASSLRQPDDAAIARAVATIGPGTRYEHDLHDRGTREGALREGRPPEVGG